MDAERTVLHSLVVRLLHGEPSASAELRRALVADGVAGVSVHDYVLELGESAFNPGGREALEELLSGLRDPEPGEVEVLANGLAAAHAGRHDKAQAPAPEPAAGRAQPAPADEVGVPDPEPSVLRRVFTWHPTYTRIAELLGIVTGVVALGAYALGAFQGEPSDDRVLEGDLTVGTAEFAVEGGSDDIPEVKDLALGFSNDLESALGERAGIPVEDAPALSVDVLRPTEAEPLTGAEFTGLAAQAQTLADRHGADTVVSASVSEDLRSVQTLIYISPDAVPDTLELAGLYPYGPPIVVRSPVDENGAARAEVREGLTATASSIAEFLMGLQRYENGNYPAAQENFGHALETWPGEEGQDLVMLFLGNTALKDDDLDGARDWYQQGLASSSDPSPRLELALLEVRFHEERGDCANPASIGGLRDLQAGYREIQQIEALPPGPLFDIRVEFGIARTAVCLAELGEGDFTEAVGHYRVVIDAFEAGNDSLSDLAAESLAGLALIADREGEISWDSEICSSTVDCYRRAASTAVDPERKSAFSDLASSAT